MPLDEALGDGNSALRDSLLQQYQQDAPTFSGDAAVLTERLSRKLAPVGAQPSFQPTDFSPPPEKVAASESGPDLSSYGTPVDPTPEPSTDDLSSFGTPIASDQPTAPEPESLGVTGQLKAGGKGLLRAGMEHTGGILQGVGTATKTAAIPDEAIGLIDDLGKAGTMTASERAKLMGRAIRTIPDRGKQMDFNAALQRIARGGDAAAESAKLREGFAAQNVEAAKEPALHKFGGEMKAAVGSAIPMTQQEQESVGGRVGTMAGTILPYAAATIALGPEAGIALGFTGMAADTYGQVYDAATKAGKTPEEASTSAKKAALAAGVLGSLPLGAGKYAKGLIAKMAVSSVAFATAGEAQEAILQQIAKDYDPKAGYSLDQKRLIAELILGAGMGGAHHLFGDQQQPPQAAPGSTPNAGALPGGGPSPGGAGPQPGAGGGGSNTNARGKANPNGWPGGTGSWSQPPGGGGPNPNAGSSGPGAQQRPGAQPGGTGAGPQPGPKPGKPPPGTGEGKGPDFTMDARMRAKMERIYRMYEPGADPSKMADHELFNAVNDHLRDTSSTGHTAKPETPEEAAAREQASRTRDEDEILRKAGWQEGHIRAMTPEQRAEYVRRAQGGPSAEQPKEPPQEPPAAAAPGSPEPEPPAGGGAGGGAAEKPPTAESTGRRDAPIVAKSVDDVLKASEIVGEPTPAQAKAGNYQHGHLELPHLGLEGEHGISVETGVGQVRRGESPDGKPWEVRMPVAYGRIKGTTGADGDHLDAFIGPEPQSPHVFLIDQRSPESDSFDEHKIMLGFHNPAAATRAYINSYSDNAVPRIGAITALGPDAFKEWLQHGDHTKRFSIPKNAAPSQPSADTSSKELATIEADPDYRHVSEDVKSRASHIMKDEGLPIDDAIEQASMRLVNEDADHGVTKQLLEDTYGKGVHDEIQPKPAHGNGGVAEREGKSDRNASAEKEAQGHGEHVSDTGEAGGKEEVTNEHLDAIERALGAMADKVAPVDVARAAELIAEHPEMSPDIAFQHAVIENAVNQGFLTTEQAEQAYGEEVKTVLGAGSEGAHRGVAHTDEGSAEPGAKRASDRSETGIVPSRGEAGEGRATGKPVDRTPEQQSDAGRTKPDAERNTGGSANKTEAGAKREVTRHLQTELMEAEQVAREMKWRIGTNPNNEHYKKLSKEADEKLAAIKQEMDLDRQFEAEADDWWQLVLDNTKRAAALEQAGISGVKPGAKWDTFTPSQQRSLIAVRKDWFNRPRLSSETADAYLEGRAAKDAELAPQTIVAAENARQKASDDLYKAERELSSKLGRELTDEDRETGPDLISAQRDLSIAGQRHAKAMRDIAYNKIAPTIGDRYRAIREEYEDYSEFYNDRLGIKRMNYSIAIVRNSDGARMLNLGLSGIPDNDVARATLRAIQANKDVPSASEFALQEAESTLPQGDNVSVLHKPDMSGTAAEIDALTRNRSGDGEVVKLTGQESTDASKWWMKDLNVFGRERVVKAAGLPASVAKTMWHNIKPENRVALNSIRGTNKDPIAERDAPTWATVLAAMPKDAKGRPDIVLAFAKMRDMFNGIYRYRDLSPSQQHQFLEAFQPEKDNGVPPSVSGRDAGPESEDVPSAEEGGGAGTVPDAEGERGAPAVPGDHQGRADGSGRPADDAGGEGSRGGGQGDDVRVPGRHADELAGREEGAVRRDANAVTGENYHVEPGALGEDRSPRTKAVDNVQAIKLANRLIEEDRPATAAEQHQLARYVGWGGIKGAFPDADGEFGKGFERIGAELREILTPDEYDTARRSIQYAHYTSEDIIGAMWKLAQQLGFDGGSVFEPGMGVGNFPGLMPPDVAERSSYQGIEIDHVSARIAKLLYPKWGVRQGDFTRTPLPDNGFDLAIGNPPFADIAIRSDPKYPQGFLLHDYFFAKSLDAVRPGGLLMFVTSAGSLNKLDVDARVYLSDRAEMVGAIRLPSNAFKKNAGTDVTTDIVILRKRLTDEPKGDVEWVHTGPITLPGPNGEPTEGRISRYFIRNPEMVLGRADFADKLYLGRYSVKAWDGFDLKASLAMAASKFPRNVMKERETPVERAEADFDHVEKKPGTFYVDKEGALRQLQNGAGVLVAKRGKGVEGGKSAEQIERIRGLIPIRDALRETYAADLADDKAAGEKARAKLNAAYDAFVGRFGPINKAEIQLRRPSVVQQETARAEAREEAAYSGIYFDEGTFDPSRMLTANRPMAEIARARKEAREKTIAEGGKWSEGSFDPEDMKDNILDKRPNIEPFMDDQEAYRLRAIEHYDDATGKASKGLVFKHNVITKDTVPDIKSINDAALYVLNQKGRLDLDDIGALVNKSKAEAIEALGDRIFRVPGTRDTWDTRDRYLSGNVRKKLAIARKEAERDPTLRRNVEALEAAQPAPLAPSQIHASLGMPWIPGHVVEKFAAEELGIGSFKAKYIPVLAQWIVSGDEHSVAAVSTYGTSRRNATALMNDALNHITPKIYDEAGDGSKVLNVADTEAAQDKLATIKEKFKGWVFADDERADPLAAHYNEEYNNLVVRPYDGSYLSTPGIASGWKWRPHQTRVIARIIQDGNTYMAHAVGAGKTSAMIGAGMEMRRLGLVNKPMYAVPNHMLAQFTKEFYEQYPTARIAVADDRNFHADRRKQFMANVALDDLDAVVITHKNFGMIPVSDEFSDQMIREEMDQYRNALSEIPKGMDSRITRSRIEKQIERLEQRLSGKKNKRTDNVFSFDEMGVDFLFVDEAQEFRKLDFTTQMSNLKGITPEGSAKAWDLYTKTKLLDKKNPGRNLVLASGTPVTNTMAELYTVSRYLQPAELDGRGLSKFDAWAGAFGEEVAELEQDAAGGYKPVSRFAKFVNVAELSAMVRQVMDVVTSRQLEQYVTRPKIAGGKRQMHLADKSPALTAYQQDLADRMIAIKNRGGKPEKGDDIMLTVIGDGRHAAIDMRLVKIPVGGHPAHDPDFPSKLDLLIDNVEKIAKATAKTKFYRPRDGGYDMAAPVDIGPATQMVFANLGLSSKRGLPVHDYIRSELARRGIPRDQIAIISEYKNHVQKQKLFNDMNSGKIRVLIGSTAKMGTGVNAQRRLIANHNLDPLWYPSDDEQRNGRILRQGNWNPEIQIHDYSTKGTYDSTMWGMMEKKSRFIQGFFEGDASMRDMEDLGEASQYAQAKALTTNDPRLMRLTELKDELERARRRKDAFESERYALKQKQARARSSLDYYTARVSAIRQDINQLEDLAGDKFTAKVGKTDYDKRVDFGGALLDQLGKITTEENAKRNITVGEISGFPIVAEVRMFMKEVGANLVLKRNGMDQTIHGTSALGITRSIESILDGFENHLREASGQVEQNEKFLQQSEGKEKARFAGQPEMDDLSGQVKALESQLAAKDEDKPPPDEPPTGGSTDLAKVGDKNALIESQAKRDAVAAAVMVAMKRLLGDHVGVEFYNDLIPVGETTAAKWGSVTGGSMVAVGVYSPANHLIKLALTYGIDSTAFHEAYHASEYQLQKPQERELMERETPRIAQWVQKKRGYTDAEINSIAPVEVRAIGAEEYMKERMAGADDAGEGVHFAVRSWWQKLWDILRALANKLRGLGFKTYEDVYRDLFEGRHAERSGNTPRPEAERYPLPTFDEASHDDTPRPDRSVTLGSFGDPSKVIATFKEFWSSTFQPEMVSDRALMADPLFARYKSAQAQEKDALIKASENEWNYWNKRSDSERIRFLDDVETAVFGAVPSDPVQAAMARRYRRMLDVNWALEKRYGSQAAFVEDYFPHIWKKPDAWRAFSAARSAQMGPTWFQKKRSIDYITDGLAAGLQLQYTNPVDIIVHRLSSGVDMRQRMELLYSLKDQGLSWEGVQGGAQLVRRGWIAINAPDRKQWVIHPDVQLLWKNGVEAKGLWQAEHLGGSIFRGWMALKNAWVPVKLAMSAFHPLHVLHINYSNGMAQGWDNIVKGHDVIGALKAVAGGFGGPLVAAPGATTGAAIGALLGHTVGAPVWGGIAGSIAGAAAFGGLKRAGLVGDLPHLGKQARKAWATRPGQQTPEQKALVELMNDGGFVPQLSQEMKIKAKRSLAVAFQEALRDPTNPMPWMRAAWHSMRRSIEVLQAPIFEQWIPSLKAAAYLNQASALLKRRPALLTYHNDRRIALRAISKSIDNRFGEMFYGSLFWNRYLKDSAIGSFLSIGWNLGFVREFGGAAFEAASRPLGILPPMRPSAPRREIRGATNKIAFAMAYMASSALILGLMSMSMDDQHRTPEGLDWVFPRIGGVNPDGSPRRITNMSYIREIPMLAKHIQERGGNALTGTAEMVYNKMLFEPFNELLNNRTYYGYNIWDENAPVYKQIWQGIKHTFGDETNPMAISGAKHAAQLSGREFPSLRESASNPQALLDALNAKGVDMSFLGFGPAPAYVEKSGIQNRISYLYGRHVAPASKPAADEENSQEKMAIRSAIMIAKRDKDQGMLELARERGRAIGLSPKYMADLGKTPTDVYLFSRLPADDQKSLLNQATPDEQARYLPHAHSKVRIEINRQRYAPPPQPGAL